ncbi:MAG: hypothetical protein JO128_09525, partial [Alphaproteobacteria bacterium]|nr:hypothetical protein [Alphaproteobacteria bacterium]
MAVAGAVSPTLAVFAYKGLAPLFFVVAIVELTLYWQEHRWVPRPALPAALLLGLFVIWGIVGATWSLDAEASLATAGKLALMAALGMSLMSTVRGFAAGACRLILRASFYGALIGLAVMAVEVCFHMPITHAIYAALRLPHAVGSYMLNPAATVLVLVVAIATGDLLNRRQITWALVIAAIVVLLAVLSQSMAAGLAGIAGAIVFAAVYWGGALVARALATVAAVGILAAPLLPSRVLGPAQEFNWPSDAIPSVYQRIGIWKFAEMRVDERPILGWGLDAARRIPGGHEGIKAESLHIENPKMRDQVTVY